MTEQLNRWRNASRIRHLAALLDGGGLIAHPTEGVFGVGCDALNTQAVHRVILLKGRAEHKGLIVLGADRGQFEALVDDAELAQIPPPTTIPTTWLVRAHPSAPRAVTGGRSTIAVRLCALPATNALLQRFGRAMVSTSANRTGHRPAQTALQARAFLGAALDGVLSEVTGGRRRPSRIIELATGRIIRA
jgi:L-threonylcarbamoyladenylate synthase